MDIKVVPVLASHDAYANNSQVPHVSEAKEVRAIVGSHCSLGLPPSHVPEGLARCAQPIEVNDPGQDLEQLVGEAEEGRRMGGRKKSPARGEYTRLRSEVNVFFIRWKQYA